MGLITYIAIVLASKTTHIQQRIMRIILALLDISYWQEVIEGLASDLFIADHYEKIKIKLDELYQMDFNPLPP